jgi:hydrogenase nickel incorporation protein HypA/HybF
MHELTIADRLLDQAVSVAADHDAERIEELVVAVGEATHLVPGQLRRCLERMASESKASDATVTIEHVQPEGVCDCGWAGTPASLSAAAIDVPNRRCPDCGDPITLTSGTECQLRSITIPDTCTT